MNEGQANDIIDLLVEISSQLKFISNKLASKDEVSSVTDKLDIVVTQLGYIEANTSNL
ncbi:hypothetical protein [Flavobacterium gilvum]|uniref:hypothetical protein n=1 Tax=Flavobacterium gilvum TaxID=1492737 RepID=UPI0004E35FF6|nr:hypothetical protein [Flavobacterium gilvum]KFC57826.1 hypothetical protein FEM08_33910 [Flavobacterium gilvum]